LKLLSWFNIICKKVQIARPPIHEIKASDVVITTLDNICINFTLLFEIEPQDLFFSFENVIVGVIKQVQRNYDDLFIMISQQSKINNLDAGIKWLKNSDCLGVILAVQDSEHSITSYGTRTWPPKKDVLYNLNVKVISQDLLGTELNSQIPPEFDFFMPSCFSHPLTWGWGCFATTPTPS
jgi:hypothetical protein